MKTYKKVKFKSREEWLKNGRKFGGSSAAAILGVSHWNKKIDIWYKFKTGKVDESKATENQTYGTLAEAPIREIVKLNLAREGVKVKSPKGIEMYVDKTYPFLTATLDGVLEVENEELTGNQTILSSNAGTLTLQNMGISNSPKYGVQAYNGSVVLSNAILELNTLEVIAHPIRLHPPSLLVHVS